MDLSGVPLSERDLFEKNEEMIRRLLDRQMELMELKEALPKTDQIGRKKLQKEYGKINRWLGDLYQAPETYADINMEGVTNKQLGERIHSHTRRVMDQWALDNRPAKQGGSTIHHADSTMQTLGAVKTAPTGMRRDIIESIKDQGKELATGLGGKNFFDVSEETHPLYHPGEGGKVDYKNQAATLKTMPSTATLDERVAAITKSTDISTAASEAADASPMAQARQADLLDRARSTGGGEVLDAMGNPFDRSNPLRTTDNIGALRKHISLSFKGGNLKYIPKIGAVGTALTVLGAVTDVRGAAAGVQQLSQPQSKPEATANLLETASSVTGLATLSPLAPVAAPVSATFAMVGGAMQLRMQKDQRLERDAAIMAGDIQPTQPDPYQTTITAPRRMGRQAAKRRQEAR